MNSAKKVIYLLKNFFQVKTAIVFIFVAVLFLSLAPAILAADIDTGLEYGEYSGLTSQDIRVTIMKVVRAALGFVGVIAIIIIIYGGFIWMTSGGNPEKVDQAKKILTNAIIGLVIIFSAFGIVSFIIGMLEQGMAPGSHTGRPDTGCEDCWHLGTGILESVYPFPGQEDVPMNTSIIVTFKVDMDPDTIMEDDDGDGTYNIKDENIKIYKYNETEDGAWASNEVTVTNVNNRTFTFRSSRLFDRDEWYEVKLEGEIKQENDEPAFGSLSDYFSWRFKVGNELDLDPVELGNVFPQPDDAGDNYAETEGKQATSSIEVIGIPQTKVEAGFSSLIRETGGSSAVNGTISGSYTGTVNALICITTTNGVFTITPKVYGSDCDNGLNYPGQTGFVPEIDNALPEEGGDINISSELTINFDGPPSGERYSFSVWQAVKPDTLKVGDKTYTFVDDVTGEDEIITTNAGNTENGRKAQAGYIKNTLSEDINELPLDPNPSGIMRNENILTLRAKQVGLSGNNIPIQASQVASEWAAIVPMHGGASSEFGQVVADVPDKARNAIITLDFNEAIAQDQLPTGGEDNPSIAIEYEDTAGDWIAVDGVFNGANEYKTVDFTPDSQCGVCKGGDSPDSPCASDDDCEGTNPIADGVCENVVNSCGQKIYCLPVNSGYCDDINEDSCFSDLECAAGVKCVYEATHYRVRVKAGKLASCTDDGCNEDNFGYCSDLGLGEKACRNGDGTGPFWPQVSSSPDGIIDVANNSFNGNKDNHNLFGNITGKADGPGYFFDATENSSSNQNNQPAYNLNTIPPNPEGKGDNLVWEFYINKNLDLTPPNIITIKPNMAGMEVSLKSSIDATFDELLMASSIKPGANYRDGYCTCGTDKVCPGNEICEEPLNIPSQCRSDEFGVEPFYCLKDKDCPGDDAICHNQKYVTLIDTMRSVGWWVGKIGLDTPGDSGVTDGYSDQTQVRIKHTTFAETTNYGAELGFGIRDVYQNCFLPSQGPDNSGNHCYNPESTAFGGTCTSNRECASGEYCTSRCILDAAGNSACCDPTRQFPYCCNGRALSQIEWEASECNTGY